MHASHVAGRIVLAYTRELTPRAKDIAACRGKVRRETALLALAHGVAGLLPIGDWSASEGGSALADARSGAIRRHLESLVALRTVADLFAKIAVPWLVFKGPILSEFMYARPDQRSYEDLDLLVPPESFEKALVALEEAGAQVLDLNWTMALQRMHGEVRLLLGPTIIDLHWHPINQRALRRRFSVDVGGVFDRMRLIELAGRAIPTLGSADTLVHVALHAAIAGADRLAWLKDVDRCLRTEKPDWEAVVERIRYWRVEPPVGGTLWRAHKVLGAPVPMRVLRRFAPPAWRGLLWSSQLVAPVERRAPGRSMSRLVSRAARETGRTTVVELGRRSVDALTRRERSASVDHDPMNSMSLLHPSGSKSVRQDYLRAVAGGDQ